MTKRSLVDLAESAGEELAHRLRIPCDIVDVHRLNDSRARIYSSLRYGAFLLAYAPLESFFTRLTRYAERSNGRALPLNLDKIQRECRCCALRPMGLLWKSATSGTTADTHLAARSLLKPPAHLAADARVSAAGEMCIIMRTE